MTLPRTQTIIRSVIIIALIVLAAWFQQIHDRLSPPFTTKLAYAKRDLLPAPLLPYITFGFTNIVTDFYWIRAIQDFIAWNGKETFFLDYFRIISTLDPRFEYPYLFSILAVPQNKDVATLDKVAEIADKGIDAIKTSWKIPFYLGTQYYLFTKTYDRPEHYLSIAATRKDAPDGVYLVYSSFITKKASKTDQSIKTSQELVKVIYNNTDNETIKELAKKGVEELYIVQLLEKGIAAYKAKYKRYPKTVDEMIAVHFISLPEELLEHFRIEINQSNGSFRIESKKENQN